MSKHTPGPWSTPGNGMVYGAPSSDGEAVFICDAAREPIIGPDGEEKANARLIAAAPDLLAALQSIANIALMDKGHWAKTIECEALAAIAKATGEQT